MQASKPVYQAFNRHNFRSISQLQGWPESRLRAIETAAHIVPFKTNNYVVNELIDWGNIPDDPIYTLNFPRKDMLKAHHFKRLSLAENRECTANEMRRLALSIQKDLNPDPSKQSANVPLLNGKRISGTQHKYVETVLLFPQAGQTCHAYCTFCFRWPQFTGLSTSKFMAKTCDALVDYIRVHPMVTDILITGGDPMIMAADVLSAYVEPFLTPGLEHLRTIRIGTKSLAYWPYRYLTDSDADKIIELFEKVIQAGKNLAFMAHFNHPVEMSTKAVEQAISRIRSTGAQIRTQSPLLRHINDNPKIWSVLWRRQVDLGCIPYYMFVERDTGAQHFFAVPLQHAWKIFREAYRRVGGLCRTVRGPVMSATPGKVQVMGVAEVHGEKVFVLSFLRGRNSEWVGRPFFARYDPAAIWLRDLKPAFEEEEFFFEHELKGFLSPHMATM